MGIAIILLAVLLLVIFLLPKGGKKKRKSDVRKIFKTTEDYFYQKDKDTNKKRRRDKNNKNRRVAVIDQRKDDGAVAVVKIYKKRGKEEKFKEGKTYIPDLVLSPENHKSLTEDSIVGRRVIWGRRENKNQPPQAMFVRDFKETGDVLTNKEFRAVKKGVQNNNRQNRKTYKRTKRKWRRHFKK